MQGVYSPEAYLDLEEKSKERHEYINGRIYAMAGASDDHIRIRVDTSSYFSQHTFSKACETFSNDMRVKVNKNNYFYPDIVIVCGDLRKDKRGNLLNPLVVIEVLSPSTQDYDLGAKLKAYLALPGLQEYLVIHQDKVQVTHYWRDEAGWRVEVVSELAGAVSLPSLGLSLPLGEAYKRVAFEPEEGGAFDDDTPPDGDEA